MTAFKSSKDKDSARFHRSQAARKEGNTSFVIWNHMPAPLEPKDHVRVARHCSNKV